MRKLGLVLAAAPCVLISLCLLTTIDPVSGGGKKFDIKKADITQFKLKILPKLDPEIKAAQAALNKAKKDLDQSRKTSGSPERG